MSNWTNFGRLSRRAGLSAIAGLSCLVPTPRSFVLMYADDILLIAPSFRKLQLLFQACESDLNS